MTSQALQCTRYRTNRHWDTALAADTTEQSQAHTINNVGMQPDDALLYNQ
jgi:hypothetical protein